MNAMKKRAVPEEYSHYLGVQKYDGDIFVQEALQVLTNENAVRQSAMLDCILLRNRMATSMKLQ